MVDRLGSALGTFTYRARFIIVVVWIALAVASRFAPSLATQGTSDQTAFLPTSSESMQAQAALQAAFPSGTSQSSATVSISRESGLTDADRAYVADLAGWVTGTSSPAELRTTVTSVDTATSRPELDSLLRSADGKLELALVNLNVSTAGSAAQAAVSALRLHIAESVPAGLEVHVTGQAGITTDYLDAIKHGTDSSTAVTVLLVIVTLLLIYRAPLAALVPLLTIGMAFLVSRGTLGMLAAAGMRVSSLLDTFIVVLVFGVGIDYTIFLISRFREEVRAQPDWRQASISTVRRIGQVITASAATVIVGLGAMAFGNFGMIQTTGPALAVAVFITLLAGLTLAPALLGIFGHYLFWPLHERPADAPEREGFFARLAAAVARRPGTVSLVIVIVLLIPTTQITSMKTNFNVLAELPATADAKLGYDLIARHLGAGNVVQSTGIATVSADSTLLSTASLVRLRDMTRALLKVNGIATVTSLVSPNGDGVVPDGFQPSKELATMAGSFGSGGSSGSHGTADLLKPDVAAGLDTAIDYLDGLAVAFPDLAGGTLFRHLRDDLVTARDQVDQVRAGVVVATQLRSLSDAVIDPTALAAASESGSGSTGSSGGAGDSTATLSGYLVELRTAYPDIASDAGYAAAVTDVAELQSKASAAVALDLSDALAKLASVFDARPGATLVSSSLAGTSQAQAIKARINATFSALPDDFRAVSAVFTGRDDDVYVPTNLPGDSAKKITAALSAFVSADRTATRFYVATSIDPYSTPAFDAIRASQGTLRDQAAGFGGGASIHLGGPTAQLADVQTTLQDDFIRVGIITVIGILLVLVLLLRSLVAPIYLVLTVMLSYGSAIGIASWLFEGVLGQPGLSSYLPLLVFVLLVALGADYNIFLMSRVREESESRSVHEGVRIASGRTGAVITSAGVILAGTFGSMVSAPLAVLYEVGAAVAIGVLLDTFVVRSILVPALTSLLGERAWWPSVRSNRAVVAAGGGEVGADAEAGSVPGVRMPFPFGAPGAGAIASQAAGLRRAPRGRLALAIGLLAVVPALIGGMLAWAMSGPNANLGHVQAAVVNDDRGAGTGALLGADLAGRLTSGAADATFDWVLTDTAGASAGLADGQYAAVLTIPAGYSASVAAIAADTTGQAQHAVLRLATNDSTNALVASVARSVARAVAASAATATTADVVDRVLVSVSDARARLAGAATSASSLATDATGLAGDAAAMSSGADQMVTGLTTLRDTAASAKEGVRKLSDGAAKLADGTAGVATGVSKLAAGARDSADGAGNLASGAASLATGLSTAATRASALPEAGLALQTGAEGVAGGASTLASGASKLASGLDKLKAGTAGLGAEAAAIHSGAVGVASRAGQLADGAAQLDSGVASLSSGLTSYAASVGQYTGGVAALAANCLKLGGSRMLCGQVSGLASQGPALVAGADKLAAAGTQVAGGASDLSAGAAKLSWGAASLSDGTKRLASAAPALETGIRSAASGVDGLSSGAASLSRGARQLLAGTRQLASGLPALVKGISSASNGATSLASGSRSLANGIAHVAAGAASLRSGAASAATGARSLSDGVDSMASGSSSLQSGVGTALDGAKVLQANAKKVATNGGTLAGNVDDLAAGLKAGTAGTQAYDQGTRDAVGRLVAAPVTLAESGPGGAAAMTPGESFAPLFMALALWAGSLATFLLLPAFLWGRRRRSVGAGPAASLGVAAGVGTAQTVLLVAVIALALGIDGARVPGLLVFGLLVAVSFAALNQALVALLGYRGWLVSFVLVALQAAVSGVLYPLVSAPAALQAISLWLPLGWAADGLRAALTGSGSMLLPTLVLVAWAGGSFGVVLLAAQWRVTRGRARASQPGASGA